MEQELVIDVKTFVEMFVAISYLNEQRIFNYDSLKNYICDNYDGFDDSADFCCADLLDQLYDNIDKMVEAGIISIIDSNLFFITDKINYKEIIETNHDSLHDMMEVFYNICGGKDKYVYVIPTKSKQKK